MNHVTTDLTDEMLEFIIMGLDALMNQAIQSTEVHILDKMDDLIAIYSLRDFLQDKQEQLRGIGE